MNKIFDVGNRAGVGFYIAAPNEAAAKELALRLGHVKSIANASVADVTDLLSGEKGVAEIIAAEKSGHVVKELSAYSIHEVIAGVKKEAKGWRFA